MVVVREESESEELNLGPEMGSAPQDPQHDGVELWARPEQETPLQGASRNLDQTIVRQKSERAAHARRSPAQTVPSA